MVSACCQENEWELNVHKQESSFTILQKHFTTVAMFDCLGKEEKYSSQYSCIINCSLFLSLTVSISGDIVFPKALLESGESLFETESVLENV